MKDDRLLFDDTFTDLEMDFAKLAALIKGCVALGGFSEEWNGQETDGIREIFAMRHDTMVQYMDMMQERLNAISESMQVMRACKCWKKQEA